MTVSIWQAEGNQPVREVDFLVVGAGFVAAGQAAVFEGPADGPCDDPPAGQDVEACEAMLRLRSGRWSSKPVRPTCNMKGIVMGNHAEWSDLVGRQVQIQKDGRTIRTGGWWQ